MIVLETPRLLFRDHEPGDLDAFCAMEADPDVRRYVGGSPRPRAAAERKFREVYLPPVPADRMALWATVFKPTGDYIGYCGIYPHFGKESPLPGEGVLAFYLARGYWNRGIATEAGQAFITFGFGPLALRRILASADVDNAASCRVLEKLGFERVNTEIGETRSWHKFALWNPTITLPGSPG